MDDLDPSLISVREEDASKNIVTEASGAMLGTDQPSEGDLLGAETSLNNGRDVTTELESPNRASQLPELDAAVAIRASQLPELDAAVAVIPTADEPTNSNAPQTAQQSAPVDLLEITNEIESPGIVPPYLPGDVPTVNEVSPSLQATLPRKPATGLAMSRREAATVESVDALKRKNASLTAELGNQIMKVRELENTLQEFEETLVEMSESVTAESPETAALRGERDAAQSDLESVERSFTELHARYERLRGVVDNQKANEEILKTALATAKHSLLQREEQFESLKQHAQNQLEGANDRVEEIERASKADNAVLVLAVKRLQTEAASSKKVHTAEITALETKLAAVTAEKNELTIICDELMDLSSLAN